MRRFASILFITRWAKASSGVIAQESPCICMGEKFAASVSWMIKLLIYRQFLFINIK